MAPSFDRRAQAVTRGVCRLFARNDIWALSEMPLRNGRRADIMGIDPKGRIVIVEIKTARGDLLGDGKWPDYLDFCDRFYWTHRLLHRPRWFRAAHAVHHASRPPTAWAAMSFHPLEALSGAVVIPVLVFRVPIHVGMLLAVLLIMTVMGVTNHMGWEMFPRALVHSRAGSWLITASHHQRHHDEYQCNYGLYFRFWDRVCGTDRGLSPRSP